MLPILKVIMLTLIAGLSALAFLEIYSLNVEIKERAVDARGLVWELESEIEGLEREKNDLIEANENLREDLDEEIKYSESLGERLEEATGEIETMRRLEEIDPELLRKYSKVYFLSENYKPEKLRDIPERFLAPTREEARFHTDAWPFLKEMLEDAEDAGVDLRVVSGYRSFEEQTELKNKYNVIYGKEEAGQFSAPQGYSEHQLGTTVDLTNEHLEGALSGFEATEAFQWLKENAHKYGFVLSYPEGNTSYIFEPWHWRFVGVELATDLHTKDKYFYDMDQRAIDEYRIHMFED